MIEGEREMRKKKRFFRRINYDPVTFPREIFQFFALGIEREATSDALLEKVRRLIKISLNRNEIDYVARRFTRIFAPRI